MVELVFFATAITILFFSLRMAFALVKGKPFRAAFYKVCLVVICYSLLWLLFFALRKNNTVPLGTDICFDDWCATVTKIDLPPAIGKQNPKGQFVIVHTKMSNHARRIAQKPSEPRVSIMNDAGNYWSYDKEVQKELELSTGPLPPIDSKLDVGQALETQIVFDIPKNAGKPMVLIEEGPFITKLLWPIDRQVFEINTP